MSQRRESRIWIFLLVLMPFLGAFSAWVTGFVQTFPASSSPFGLPFPWKLTTYSYSSAWCPGGNFDVCYILGFSIQTVIDLNAFIIDDTLFAAAGYALMNGVYLLMSGVSYKGMLFYGRIESILYYNLIPVFGVFLTLLTGFRGTMFQWFLLGFPFGWRPACPSNPSLEMACILPDYSWTAFALDVIFYSVVWYGFLLTYTRHLAARHARFAAKNASKVPI